MSDIIVEEESRLVPGTRVVNNLVDDTYGNDDVSMWIFGDVYVYWSDFVVSICSSVVSDGVEELVNLKRGWCVVNGEEGVVIDFCLGIFDVIAVSVVCIVENLCDDCNVLVDDGKRVEYESIVVGLESSMVTSEDSNGVVFVISEKSFDDENRVNFGDLVLEDESERCNGDDKRERREGSRVVLDSVNGDDECGVEEISISTDNDEECEKFGSVVDFNFVGKRGGFTLSSSSSTAFCWS